MNDYSNKTRRIISHFFRQLHDARTQEVKLKQKVRLYYNTGRENCIVIELSEAELKRLLSEWGSFTSMSTVRRGVYDSNGIDFENLYNIASEEKSR